MPSMNSYTTQFLRSSTGKIFSTHPSTTSQIQTPQVKTMFTQSFQGCVCQQVCEDYYPASISKTFNRFPFQAFEVKILIQRFFFATHIFQMSTFVLQYLCNKYQYSDAERAMFVSSLFISRLTVLMVFSQLVVELCQLVNQGLHIFIRSVQYFGFTKNLHM